MNPKDRIIFALDVPAFDDDAQRLVEKLYLAGITCFKVGLTLLVGNGGEKAVRWFLDRINQGVQLMLDYKFHDIPFQVAGAAKNVSMFDLRPKIVTVHASGGRKMVRAAVEAFQNTDTWITGITVLTSLDKSECEEIYGLLPEKAVVKLAGIASEGGAQAVVCSPHEVKLIKSHPDLKHLNVITPGIKYPDSDKGDQARVTTPYQAILNGADMIVMGRHLKNPPESMTIADRVGQVAGDIARGLNDRQGG